MTLFRCLECPLNSNFVIPFNMLGGWRRSNPRRMLYRKSPLSCRMAGLCRQELQLNRLFMVFTNTAPIPVHLS